MTYLLLDATDEKTIKSVSSGEFTDIPKEYISVEIETVNEEFKEDYSLFEYIDGSIKRK